jgi:hypothetical protein
MSNCGFPELSLIWLLPGREVHCGICNIPGPMWRHSISSPNVVCAAVTSGSNGSNPVEWYRVRVRTGTELLQWFYHMNPQTVAFGLGCTLIPGRWKIRLFALVEYLSSDRIVTWWICRLCTFSRSFTSGCQLCDTTNIRRVAIENPRISLDIGPYLTATQRKSVGSQIWKREVKESLKLDNLRIDHVTIQSELKYIIGANTAGTGRLELQSSSNLVNNPQFYVRSGSQPTMTRLGLVCG